MGSSHRPADFLFKTSVNERIYPAAESMTFRENHGQTNLQCHDVAVYDLVVVRYNPNQSF